MMTSEADYPGFTEPEPEEEEKRFPKIRRVATILWAPIARVLVASAAAAQMFIAGFTGALLAIEMNRGIAGQPPLNGIGYFYAILIFMFVAYYIIQDHLERNHTFS